MLSSDTPHRDLLRGVIRGACLAAQKNWVAARPYLQTAYDTGCRDLLCLRWLGVTLFASNDFPAAEPVLRQWLAARRATLTRRNISKRLSREYAPRSTRRSIRRRRQDRIAACGSICQRAECRSLSCPSAP